MGRITTHVLDTAAGRPAAGLKVILTRLDGTPTVLAEAVTNADGRCDKPLLEGAAFAAGQYEIVFHVGDYFRRTGVGAARAAVPRSSCRSASASPRTRTITCRCWSRPTATRPIGAADARADDPLSPATARWSKLAGVVADADAARLSAPDRARDRHQGRLRRGRLRRLHGGARPAARRASSSTSRSMPASSSLGQLDGMRGRHRRGSRGGDGTLHPVQQAMVDMHGSQCGFCTPGFVMSLFALYQRARRPVDRAGGQRLARRQSLPLHRLSADRRCGARRLRGSAPATGSRRGSRRRAARARRPCTTARTSSSATSERFFAAPATIDVARRAL